MFRTIPTALLLGTLSSTAHARQHGPIVLTKEVAAASALAAVLDLSDPDSGWAAADGEAEAAAAKTKADILIESRADGTVIISYDPGLLDESPWAEDIETGALIYAIETGEQDDPNGGVIIIGRDDPVASIVEPATYTWADAASEHLAYLVVDPTGRATVAFPSRVFGLETVEIQ